MAKMTKKGALAVTSALDRIATLFQQDFAVLGVPQHIAADFAYRCDLLSDRVERTAGLKRQALTELDVNKEKGFDPEAIGEEQSGPLEGDSDEGFMKGEFTQQENRELRERVQDGDLGIKTNLEPQNPTSGKQASVRLASLCGKMMTASASIKKASVRAEIAKLASAALAVQANYAAGTANAAEVVRVARALGFVLPVIASGDLTKLASALALANKIVAKKADEDEDEEDEDEGEEVASKKAGEIPPQFLENAKKKQEEAKAKDDDKGEGDKEEKKASHGFDLFG